MTLRPNQFGSYQTYEFDVQTFAQSVRVPDYMRVNARRDDELQCIVVDVAAKFAMGKTITQTETKTDYVHYYTFATKLDTLKHWLTEWQPSLRFGWLVPKRTVVEVPYTYDSVVSNTNIIPVDWKHGHYKWLVAEPIKPLTQFRQPNMGHDYYDY